MTDRTPLDYRSAGVDLEAADDAKRRIKRLVESTTNPNFEELRLLYSQSAFSNDGRTLAFTAQREGKDVLYLLDVARQKTERRIDLPLEGVTSPSWSPDGKRLVFSGHKGGISDLYVVDVNGRNLRRLTNDRHGDLQPQWSPDGKMIAFASDRGAETNFELLPSSKCAWRYSTDREDRIFRTGLAQSHPVWPPDGKRRVRVASPARDLPVRHQNPSITSLHRSGRYHGGDVYSPRSPGTAC